MLLGPLAYWRKPRDFETHWFRAWLIDRLGGDSEVQRQRENRAKGETASPSRKLVMEARAYDDAVAFRYLVPEQAPIREFRLAKETTEFRIAKDPFIYALFLPNYRSMYESEFIKLSEIGRAHV